MTLNRKIEKIIHAEKSFPAFSFASLLHAFSTTYGAIAKIRAELFDKGVLTSHKLPAMVISIGNIVAGGSGKTPMTIYLARQLKSMGVSVAILSRGYKGSSEKKGAVVSNGKVILKTPVDAGDEPFLMARTLPDVPVLVGAVRYQSGLKAINRFHSNVILLDDGFQHHKLQKDLNLVLLDSGRPFGNGYLLPRGPLREPLSALDRADAFILTRNHGKQRASHLSIAHRAGNRPVFTSVHIPKIRNVIKHKKQPAPGDIDANARDAFLFHKNVLAFSGLAKNHVFKKTVNGFDCKIQRFISFPDHHSYAQEDIFYIEELAKRLNVDAIVTTEKDAVKIPDDIKWPVDFVVVGIDLKIVQESEFRAFILNWLKHHNIFQS